jgi:hypothetical protein
MSKLKFNSCFSIYSDIKISIFIFFFAYVIYAVETDSSCLKFGNLKYEGKSTHYIGLNYSLAGNNYRLLYEEYFPGFKSNERLGLNFIPMSFAFSTERDKQLFSINLAFMLYSVGIVFAGLDDSYDDDYMSYGGLSSISTAILLPQLLTNWSIRYDFMKQKIGLWAGPITDYLANFPNMILIVRPELHCGAYVSFYSINITSSIAYDVSIGQNKYYLGVLFGNREEKSE